MKKTTALLLLAALAALPLRAVPPTQQSIDELLVAAKVEKAVDSMTANLDQTIRRTVQQAIPGQALTPADEKVLATLRTRMAGLMAQELGWDKIKDLYEKVYAETFTQEEIDGLIAFYKTPVGQVFADKSPEITQKTAGLMQRRMMPVIVQLRGAVHESIEQIVAAHQQAAPDAEPDGTEKSPVAPPSAPAAAPMPPKAPKTN